MPLPIASTFAIMPAHSVAMLSLKNGHTVADKDTAARNNKSLIRPLNSFEEKYETSTNE